MALDNFIGWTMQDKKALLLAVQQANVTQQVVRVKTDNGVETEFNGKDPMHIQRVLRSIEQSIANDPSFDENDEVQAACAANKVNRKISSRYPDSY